MSDRKYVFLKGFDKDVDLILQRFEPIRAEYEPKAMKIKAELDAIGGAVQKEHDQFIWRPLFLKLQELGRIPSHLAYEDVDIGTRDDEVIYYSVLDKDDGEKKDHLKKS